MRAEQSEFLCSLLYAFAACIVFIACSHNRPGCVYLPSDVDVGAGVVVASGVDVGAGVVVSFCTEKNIEDHMKDF